MTEKAQGEIGASVGLDIVAGSANASLKLGAVEQVVKYLLPARYARAQNLETVALNIRRQLETGKSLADLTALEQHVLLAAAQDSIGKVANRAALLERAAELDSGVRGLLEAPEGTPVEPDETPTGDSEAYFWNRFWSDAEVVTVAYVRELYARLLVAKRTTQRAMSLRTLDVVRCLDEDGARLFHFACQFLLDGRMLPDLFDTSMERKPPLHSGHLALLVEYGLVSGEALGRRLPAGPFKMGEWYLMFNENAGTPFAERSMKYYPLTRAGAELVAVVNAEVPVGAVREACRLLSTPNFPGTPTKRCVVSHDPNGPWLEPDEAFQNPVTLSGGMAT